MFETASAQPRLLSVDDAAKAKEFMLALDLSPRAIDLARFDLTTVAPHDYDWLLDQLRQNEKMNEGLEKGARIHKLSNYHDREDFKQHIFLILMDQKLSFLTFRSLMYAYASPGFNFAKNERKRNCRLQNLDELRNDLAIYDEQLSEIINALTNVKLWELVERIIGNGSKGLQWEVIHLTYVVDCNDEAIAGLLRVSSDRVRDLRFQAMEKLREQFACLQGEYR